MVLTNSFGTSEINQVGPGHELPIVGDNDIYLCLEWHPLAQKFLNFKNDLVRVSVKFCQFLRLYKWFFRFRLSKITNRCYRQKLQRKICSWAIVWICLRRPKNWESTIYGTYIFVESSFFNTKRISVIYFTKLVPFVLGFVRHVKNINKLRKNLIYGRYRKFW